MSAYAIRVNTWIDLSLYFGVGEKKKKGDQTCRRRMEGFTVPHTSRYAATGPSSNLDRNQFLCKSGKYLASSLFGSALGHEEEWRSYESFSREPSDLWPSRSLVQ